MSKTLTKRFNLTGYRWLVWRSRFPRQNSVASGTLNSWTKAPERLPCYMLCFAYSRGQNSATKRNDFYFRLNHCKIINKCHHLKGILLIKAIAYLSQFFFEAYRFLIWIWLCCLNLFLWTELLWVHWNVLSNFSSDTF